ncbi:hypothetical protein EVAR_35446_1 [Eumeta japonica]|uniref:Uncharacterized protein n=1 Tax=Eumeta variegata TaxID=151549 RepID=A0A4C1Z896_EUMVA|nr:hypothetical protein EVAR_35446_1 [Eumeta japonica]
MFTTQKRRGRRHTSTFIRRLLGRWATLMSSSFWAPAAGRGTRGEGRGARGQVPFCPGITDEWPRPGHSVIMPLRNASSPNMDDSLIEGSGLSGRRWRLRLPVRILSVQGLVTITTFVRGSFTPLFLRVQVRDGGLMLPHARASSRRGYDPDGPVVMAPFRGSKLEKFPSQPEIKRSCQWVHRHHPRPSRPSLRGMVKWWVAAPSGLVKLDDGEPRRSRKTTMNNHLITTMSVKQERYVKIVPRSNLYLCLPFWETGVTLYS